MIFLGLGLLAAEFVWARRLMDRMKREGGRFKDTVMGKSDDKPPEAPAESAPPAQASASGDDKIA